MPRTKGKPIALDRRELLWLPEPQERVVLGPMPGRREDGQFWFDGPRKTRKVAEDRETFYRGITLGPDDPKPRDVRRGDKWLPWH
jgi:hypothetical protein